MGNSYRWERTEGFEKLEERLLSIGGDRVVALPEPHLTELLERGRAFSAEGVKRGRGRLHYCHVIAAFVYARHQVLGGVGVQMIATGYGLSDGIWRQHSWLWDGKRVIETNGLSELYFGFVMTRPEAAGHVLTNLMPLLPGIDEFFNSQRLSR